jgi:parvulin-like peptidyl-prolyl isomerase
MADKAPPTKSAPEAAKKIADRPRSSIKNPLVWGFSFILLVIIVIAFVVAPIYSPIAADSQKITFGSYDGAEIAYKAGNYFASQYDAIKSNNSTQGTDNVQAEYSALKSAFDRTVLHTAVLKTIQDLGVSVSDAKINETLATDARFQDNGTFSKEKLAKYNQLEMMNLRHLTRDDILQKMLMQDLINGAVVSSKESGFIKDLGRTTRSFEYVSFTQADYPDAEVLAYAQQNAKLFRSLTLSVLTVAKKADADTYRQQILDKKASFEDSAKNHSIDMYKASSGVRGQVTYNELKLELGKAELADKVFGLKKGDLSEVLTVPAGFAVYRIDSDVQELKTADPSAVKSVRDYLIANEKGKVEDYLNAQAGSFVAAARKDGLDKAAKAANKKPALTNSFPINYGGIVYPTMFGNYPVLADPATADNKALSDAGNKEAFFEAAFKLAKDAISDPIVLSDEIIVLKLKDEKTAADDNALGMYASFAPNLAAYFVSADLQDKIVDSKKLVDNFDKTFIAHFMPKQ